MTRSTRGFARSASLAVSNLLVAVALAPSPALAAGGDAPPTTPATLTARAYSATAGGIRWQRSTDDSGVVAGYEVARSDVVLGVVDALSYVDFSLAPGRRYAYTVTAIDSAGQRSESARVTLVTPPNGSIGAGPTGLRAAIYSSTALGLAWDRSPTPGMRYEVSRDNEPLSVTDGTSFIDTGLDNGRHAYTIVAITPEGRRSAPSAITVTLHSHDGPNAPADLRAAVYSPTAAELFWRRPDTVGLRYEIFRDGEQLATIDGVSYFDDTLEGGRSYRYEVVALDRHGRRSIASSISLSTPGG